jgi:hypothetical protein
MADARPDGSDEGIADFVLYGQDLLIRFQLCSIITFITFAYFHIFNTVHCRWENHCT